MSKIQKFGFRPLTRIHLLLTDNPYRWEGLPYLVSDL